LRIASVGLGTFAGATGWAVSVGTEPASPDTAITAYDTGGAGPDTDQLDIEQPTIQVRVRSGKGANAYADAYAKQRAILAALLNVKRVVLDGYLYVGITPTSDILPIGRDDNDRFLLTAKFRVTRQPA
jgi:hypothetical protein